MTSTRNHPAGRTTRRLLTVAAGILGSFVLAAPASAALRSFEDPIAANGGFPASHTDFADLQLQVCDDGPPLCGIDAVAGAVTDEGFWWSAEATTPNGLLVLAQEAVVDPDFGNISFGRIRLRIDNLVPDAEYKITHPYGVDTFTADDAGSINNTEEVGCAPASAAEECAWAEALSTRIGPFLRWDTSDGSAAPPAGYVGDGATLHKVVGSPSDQNVFRIEGPNGVVEETDLFTVVGKLQDGATAPATPFLSYSPRRSDFGSSPVGSARTQNVTVKNKGFGPLNVTSASFGGPNASDYSVAANGCSVALQPGQTCTIGVSFTPSGTGARPASLTLAHNGDPQVQPSQTATLSGTGTPAPQQSTTTGTQPVAPALAGPVFDARTLRASVSLRRSYRLRSARRNGVLVRYRAPAGADKVSFTLYRVGNAAARKLVLRKSVRVTGTRLKSLRLRSRRLTTGRYRLQVRPSAGGRKGRLSTRSFRIVR